MKPPAVVGIDPGTTIGYAIVSLNGKLIEAGSGRTFDFNSLLMHITGICQPIIIATDKAEPPGMVRKFATRSGARLWHPEKDLLIKEKKEVSQHYLQRNDHEMDAIASARFALNDYSDLINRISRFVKDKGKEALEYEITRLVIQHGMSIATAIEFLEQPESEESKLVKSAVEKGWFGKEYESLLERNRALKLKLAQIEENLSKLQEVLRTKEALLNTLKKKKLSESDILKMKESSIRSLSSKLGSMEAELSRMRAISLMKDIFISAIQGRVLMKRLRDFSEKEILTKSRLGFRKDDFFFVDDPSIISEKAIQKLTDIRVFSSKRIKTRLPIRIFCITAKPYAQIQNFLLFEKKDVEDALLQTDVIGRVVEEYRKERIN